MQEQESAHLKRIQLQGRSILSHVQQMFRNADLFEHNNQVFINISKTLSRYLHASFQLISGCSLRIQSHQVFLEDSRVFVDAGMLEGVRFLSEFFDAAEIGGIQFHEECFDPAVLLKALFSLRSVVLDDKARGKSAVEKGLARLHMPYISPLPFTREENTMTGLRDEENAKKFALRNIAKLIMFLEDFQESIDTQDDIRLNVAYRVLMNLIRVNESYPDLLMALCRHDLEEPTLNQIFHRTILVMAIGGYLDLPRQIQTDLSITALFGSLGVQTVPPSMRYGEQNEAQRISLPERGARQLLQTRFVNRSLYFRLVSAFQTPAVNHPKCKRVLPLARLMRTVDCFVTHWKSSRALPQMVLMHLFQSNDPAIDKSFLMILAKTLTFLPPGTLMIMDRRLPIMNLTSDREGLVKMKTVPPGKQVMSESYRWDRNDSLQNQAWPDRLMLAKPSVKGPNACRALLKPAAN